jgi:hypothetical protein
VSRITIGSEGERKGGTWRLVGLSGILALAIACVFASPAIVAWAEGIKIDGGRAVAVAVARPFGDLVSRYYLDRPYRFLRSRFLDFLASQNGSRPETGTERLSSPAASTPTASPDRYDADHPLSVLLIGDSLAWCYLPTKMSEAFRDDPRFRFKYEYKISSTLSDPTVFDWIAEAGRLTAGKGAADGKAFDLIVVAMGANDAQSIYLPSGKLAYGSDPWVDEFSSRAREFMGILSANSSKTYWLGIPPMRKEGYRDRMVRMNGLYRGFAAEFPNLSFIPVERIVGDENGLYVPTKTVDGIQASIRSKDGIHYDYAGARLIADRVMELIFVDFPLGGRPRG